MRRITHLVKPLVATATLLFIAACAGQNPHDPYEGYNRKVHAFNTAFDEAISRPVAKGYTIVVPQPVRRSFGHAFSNLDDTKVAVIDVTQGRFEKAAESLHRFVFNSTFGLLGFIDLTNAFNLPKKHTNDFGTTLAKYGWKKSNYFVIPFIGPSTPRDGIGVIGDIFARPYIYAMNKYASAGLTAASLVHLRSELLDVDSVSKKAALDAYVFQREAYLQYRNNLLQERGVKLTSKVDPADLDDEDELSIAEMARRRHQIDGDEEEEELSLSELARQRNQ